MQRIVVGVDGSSHSDAALRWALREARAHGAALDVVTAWHYPYTTDISGMVPRTVAGLDVAEDARKLQDKALEDALLLEPFPGGSIEIERIVKQGGAAHVLLEAADGADLLVVGSRGRGGFTGLLLGSVSHQVASHAPCPVVVVRD
jgi:nucleotide-binding universal stress UspA family protein